MSPGWHLCITFLLTMSCLTMVLRGVIRLRGTTMLAPCVWAALFLIAVCTIELIATWAGPNSIGSPGALRFAGYMTCFCPGMALLGAKRPQNRAWQFVVLTLWLILTMPAVESLAFSRYGYLKVQDARGAFLWILILFGLFNVVSTRFVIAGVLAACGQAVLLAEYLPGLRGFVEGSHVLPGLLLVTSAIGLVYFGMPKRRVALTPEDQLWLDFRDTYGVVWGLRIAERINASADRHHWDLWLQWTGFVGAQETSFPDSIDDSTRAALRKSMRMLLRRFVSVDWIRQRKSEERPG